MALKNLLPAAMIILTAGCASDVGRMDRAGMVNFKVDCNNKQAQLAFLQKQIPARGTFFDRDSRAEAAARHAIDEINRYCP